MSTRRSHGAAPRIIKGAGIEHEAEINRATITPFGHREGGTARRRDIADVEGFEAVREGAAVERSGAVETAAMTS